MLELPNVFNVLQKSDLAHVNSLSEQKKAGEKVNALSDVS